MLGKLEQNRIVQIIQNSIIFQCSENYGSPTNETMLKVAQNMADPISLKENGS